MVVAIDGPAGSGKSALAKLIAQRLDFFLLNSGYFYRAITYFALQDKDMSEKRLINLSNKTIFSIKDKSLQINGQHLERHLHSDEVDAAVAKVSSCIEVRNILNEKMRTLSTGLKMVCEGRDMTSVVFTDAKIKIYLDASVEIRAKRRFNQEYSAMSLDEIQKSIQNRDEIDKQKAIGALKRVPDAWYIDSSDKTLEDLYAMIAKRIVEIEQ